MELRFIKKSITLRMKGARMDFVFITTSDICMIPGFVKDVLRIVI